MPTPADATTEQQLKDLAAAEMAAAKERLTIRTTAARHFAAAETRRAEAATAWELAQTETAKAQRLAIDDLITSGMKPADIAHLLGINTKDLRALRTVNHPHIQHANPTPAGADSDTRDVLAS